MKKVYLGLLVGIVFSMQVVGDELVPYMGLNAQVRELGFKKGYGKENFEPKLPAGEILLGLKINPYLGFEFGYLRSFERNKRATTTYPDLLLGTTLEAGPPSEFERADASSRIDGGSVSVAGFLPISEDIQLLGSLGIARLRVKLRYTPFDSDLGSYTSAQVQNGIRTFVACRYVPQAKLGVQYMLTQVVGLKGMLGWEGTSRFDLLANKQAKPARVTLKDSYNVGLGLAYYFN